MTTHRFVAPTRIARVWERRKIVEGTAGSYDPETGQQKPGSLSYASDGWWITTEGPSPISMKVGDAKPEGVEPGKLARIVVEI